MADTIIGVDIGSGVIRAAELSGASKSRPTLVKYHSVALPPSAVRNGEVVEKGTVTAALKQLWSQARFSSKKVVLGVGNQRVLVRDMAMPTMPLERIKESLPFQAQELLPLPVAEALLDFYPISEGVVDNKPVINGLLIAAVKEAVLANVEAAQEAGLDPVEVDLIPFALARSLMSGSDGRGTVSLVQVGAVTTTIIVAHDGIPQFVRILQNGSDEVNKALVQRLGVTPDQAEQVKRTMGLAPGGFTPDWQPAIEVIFAVTSDLLANIRNTLSFWVNSRPGSAIDRVLLSGGGGEMPGVAAALADVVRLPVGTPNAVDSFSVQRGLDVSRLRAESSGVAVAAGLAMGSRK